MNQFKAKPGFINIQMMKNESGDGYRGCIEAETGDVLVEALAILIQQASVKLGVGVDLLYAKVATLLFVAEETRTKEIPTSPAAPRNDSRGHTPQRKRKNHKKRKGGKRNGNAD